MSTHTKEHSILPGSEEWDVVEIRLTLDLIGTARRDLVFERDQRLVHLRFENAQQIEFDGPLSSSFDGLAILDVSDRQLDGLNIRVVGWDAPFGAMSFWAKSIHRVESDPDQTGTGSGLARESDA